MRPSVPVHHRFGFASHGLTEPNERPETGRYGARHADCYNYHIIKITHIRLLFTLGLALAPLAPAYAQTTSANLGWDPDTSPSVAGYRLHTGTSSGVYTQTTEVGNVTAAAVSNLTTGKTYYFVVTAYNNGRVDGPPSNEVSFIAGSTPPPTPTPSATPTAAPTPIAPTNLAAAAASSSQINLSWIDRA